MAQSGVSQPRSSDLALYRRLLGHARPFWGHMVGIFLLSLLAAPLALLTPIPLKIAVDNVIGSRPLPGVLQPLLAPEGVASDTVTLIFAAVLTVVIALLQQLQGYGSWLWQLYAGEKMSLHFRAQLFRHVQRLSLIYHDQKGTADSLYRIQQDAPSIQHVAIQSVIPFITSGFTLAGMIYVMARLDWMLAMVALAVLPLLLLVMELYRRRMRSGWAEVKQHETQTLSVLQEVLSSLRVVKAFGQENREQQRFSTHAGRSLGTQLRVVTAESGFGIASTAILASGTAVALYIGVIHVQTGVLTVGELLVVMAYLAQLYQPLETMSKKIGALQSSLASAERAFALLDESPDVPEKASAQPLARARGSVEFRGVSFAYGSHAVLQNVSFAIPAGTRVGIAGRTGAGKTTLINLLPRFYDPTAGQILLDGVDVREFALADLRNQFAIVLQEPVLFSTTIADNIAYGHAGASEQEIIEAAKAAHAHEFIMKLPAGYETPVGERGMTLSGGERQRISLARAFLKDAPILILDEPTSAVDVESEAIIMDAMERLMHNRTSFMIAHRLSTLEKCHVRLQLEAGQLTTTISSSRDTPPTSPVVATHE